MHTFPPFPEKLIKHRVQVLLVSVCLLLGSGCAFYTDQSPGVDLVKSDRIQTAKDIRLSAEGWPSAQWWKKYGDDQLDALIKTALADSPTIQMAQSRVDQAGSMVKMASASTGPFINALGSIDRTSVSANGFLGPFALNMPQSGFTGPWYTAGLVGVAGGMKLDVFGKDRALTEAAIGVQNARIAELAMVRLDLATHIAQLYFELQVTRQKIMLLNQALGIEIEKLDSIHAKRHAGLASETSVQLIESQKSLVEGAISAEEAREKVFREAIRALLDGNVESVDNIKTTALPETRPQLPTDLRYDLLARRPDLQAYRWYVQSSLSQIDAAKAAFYPSFDIKAFFGVNSLNQATLFNYPASRQINLIPGLYLPIFNGGMLSANLENARSTSNATIALYNQAVLNAVSEVSQQGAQLQDLETQLALSKARLENLSFANESAQAFYGRGLINKAVAAESKIPLVAQQIFDSQMHGQRLIIELALIRALGGGAEQAASK